MPGTPSPFHTLSASVARRRRRNRVRPGPGWCFVRSTPERPLSRSEPFRPRHLRACGRPAVPRRDQRGLGPPRTRLGGFTRLSTLLLRSEPESSFLRWFVGPSGSDSPCRVRRGSILEGTGAPVNPGGRNPQDPEGFPQDSVNRAQAVHRNEPVAPRIRCPEAGSGRWESWAQVPRTAPDEARTATEDAVPWIPAAAPEAPTRRSLTSMVTWYPLPLSARSTTARPQIPVTTASPKQAQAT